jgi:hypothetical protein
VTLYTIWVYFLSKIDLDNIIFIVYKNYMEQSILDEYLASLSEKQMKAYLIAKSHLGMSFSLEKSSGFVEWYKTR